MVIRRNSKHNSNSRRPSKKNQQQRERRQLFLENLEDRRLLHGGGQHVPISGAEVDPDADAGFEIVGAQLNNGDILNNGDVLNQSPRDITLHFAHDVMIDGASLDGVVLLKNGVDGNFSHASAVTGLGTSGGQVQLSFSALVDGVAGNGIEIVFTRSDHENDSGPSVQIQELDSSDELEDGEVHTRIVVDLNTNELNPTTAGQIVDVLADHVDVSKIVHVEVVEGNPETIVSTNPVTTYSPVRLSGSDDITVDPGYLGVESDGHDVVFRFRESLQDGDYRLIVNGGGSQPLRNQNGDLFLNGQANELIDFSIDRGPQVLAVVPQPVVRDAAGMLTQHRNQVHVYFNEDDLAPDAAENRALYQLIFSANTLNNVDDLVHIPDVVEYSSEMDMAVLTFAQPLDELDGGGVYRLRIGDTVADADDTIEVVGATTSSDSNVVQATLSDDTDTAGTQYTRLEITSGNADLESLNVEAGDIVRYLWGTDGFGNDTYSEFVVSSIINESALLLTTAHDEAVGTAEKVEIWHTRDKNELAAAIGTNAGAWGNRRVRAVWPDNINQGGQLADGMYLAAALAGLTSGVVPHQGLTNLQVSGFDDASRSKDLFNGDQLNTMANSGVWVITQDDEGNIITRHALTTDSTDLNSREEMVVRNVDSMSYLFLNRLSPFIGRTNVTPSALDMINVEVTAAIDFLKANGYTDTLGGQLIDGEITQLRQHALLKDRVVIVVNLEIPYPMNNVEVHLVV